MNIIVLGSTGLLGSAIVDELMMVESFTVHSVDRIECDVTNVDEISCVINKYEPDILINCTGYTNVDGCEKNRDIALNVNAIGVKNIAIECEKYDVGLIHISSDAVFGDSKRHVESDAPCPINYYGQTKRLAERYISEIMKDYWIIRTSSLFGPNGKNFVDSVLDQIIYGKVKVVGDQITQPTYTRDLALAIVQFINGDYDTGIYHLTNSSSCSWYEFACAILGERNVIKITTYDLNRVAKRPILSYIRNTKLPRLRSWKKALEEYL